MSTTRNRYLQSLYLQLTNNSQPDLTNEILACFVAYAISEKQTQTTLKQIIEFFPEDQFEQTKFAKSVNRRLRTPVLPSLTSASILTCETSIILNSRPYRYEIVKGQERLVYILKCIWLDYCDNNRGIKQETLQRLYPFTGLSKN